MPTYKVLLSIHARTTKIVEADNQKDAEKRAIQQTHEDYDGHTVEDVMVADIKQQGDSPIPK